MSSVVEKGDVVTLRVQGLGTKNDFFGYIDRRVCFLRFYPRNLDVGDNIRAEIMNVKPNWISARFKERLNGKINRGLIQAE